jgi:mannose-6-phosphate isomerase-like protein (cupin superfamily)
MSQEIHDPVSRVWQTFSAENDSLIVDTRMADGGSLPPHLHPKQEELWSVVEGQVTFRLGNDERVLTAADGEQVVRPGVVHGLRNESGREARLRCVVTPPLRLQSFLEEAAAAGQRGLFTQSGRPRGLTGMRWAARFLKTYRDETVFLSPPAPVQRLLIALFAR